MKARHPGLDITVQKGWDARVRKSRTRQQSVRAHLHGEDIDALSSVAVRLSRPLPRWRFELKRRSRLGEPGHPGKPLHAHPAVVPCPLALLGYMPTCRSGS